MQAVTEGTKRIVLAVFFLSADFLLREHVAGKPFPTNKTGQRTSAQALRRRQFYRLKPNVMQ
jgi:hypothetical protein